MAIDLRITDNHIAKKEETKYFIDIYRDLLSGHLWQGRIRTKDDEIYNYGNYHLFIKTITFSL